MLSVRQLAAVVVAGGACAALAAGPGTPLTPVEARKKVGQAVTVEMTVRAAKDRLKKRGEVYCCCRCLRRLGRPLCQGRWHSRAPGTAAHKPLPSNGTKSR
jgi:hypothetical protein